VASITSDPKSGEQSNLTRARERRQESAMMRKVELFLGVWLSMRGAEQRRATGEESALKSEQ
jgi:hypothetical protein